jgi:predicted nuclease with TOPRIM domain
MSGARANQSAINKRASISYTKHTDGSMSKNQTQPIPIQKIPLDTAFKIQSDIIKEMNEKLNDIINNGNDSTIQSLVDEHNLLHDENDKLKARISSLESNISELQTLVNKLSLKLLDNNN